MKIWSIPEEAESLFRGEHLLRVHSAYHRVVNLVEKGRLWAVHGEDVAKTPLSLVFDGPSAWLDGLHLTRGMSVLLSEGRLILGTVVLDGRERKTWDAVLKTRIKEEKTQHLCRELGAFLTTCTSRGGLSDAMVSRTLTGELMEDVLRETAWQAQDASHPNDLREPLNSLVGMGPGLTPSGDDFAVGLLCGFLLTGEEAWFRVTAETVADALCRTNDVSGAFLRCALQGQYGEKLHALADCGTEEIASAIRAAAASGHSSGIDTLNGLYAALNRHLSR